MPRQTKLISDSPEGLIYVPHFISPNDEKTLLENIQLQEWEEVKMHGRVARRRVIHYGLNYTYDSRTVTPTLPPPSFLNVIINKGAKLIDVDSSDIAEILISEYSIGAGIGWHRDAPMFSKIIGISLGSECVIKFRKAEAHNEVYKLDLAPGSAYVLSGAARNTWQHSISPVKTLRYSITLRTLRKKI